VNPKYIPYSVISSLVVLEVLSIATANSLRPWAVLFHDSLALKIVGWYLALQLILSLIAYLIIKLVIPDKDCPVCNRDLKSFIPVYGNLVMCNECSTWFHKNCRISKGNQCPVCFPALAEDIPLDFTSNLPHSTPKNDGV